jgi:hypothetical protein
MSGLSYMLEYDIEGYVHNQGVYGMRCVQLSINVSRLKVNRFYVG